MKYNKPVWNYSVRKFVYAYPKEENVLLLLKELYNEAYDDEYRENDTGCLRATLEGMKDIIQRFSKEKNDGTQM